MIFQNPNREAYANYLRAKYEAYTGASQVRSLPYYLVVEPSDTCQLRCTTCPTGMENESRKTGDGSIRYRGKRATMKPELFNALLDELGPYLFLVMFYSWGEPLLNKSLSRYIRRAHDMGIDTEVHSNLSLPLSAKRIDELLSSGLGALNGSIDGFSQEAYGVHRVGGDVELVKLNLEALVEARSRLGVDTRITYKMLIFSHNEHEIKAVRRYCKNLGIEFIPDDAGIKDPSWLPSHRQGEAPYFSQPDLDEMVANAARFGAADYFSEYELGAFYAPNDKAEEDTLPDFCSWHYGMSVVTGGGPVAPCCGTAKDRDDLGVVVPDEVRFSDVWNNDRFRHARAVIAGDEAPTSGERSTLCDRCHFPKVVKQIYGVHDVKISAAFHRRFKDGEPALEAGFRLLNRLRYGAVAGGLLRRGIYHPLMMLTVGRGDERSMQPFVDFYEQYLDGLASGAAAST